MTHAEKIADYRAALENQDKAATETMQEVCQDNDTWNTWYGYREGIRKAQSMLKMLD